MQNQFRLACALLAASIPTFAAEPFGLHDGDRVVFYGDSITDQRLYTVITETYITTRYPQLGIRFIHSGWGGDRVSGGGGGPIDVRLNRDVIAYKPTVMTIMLGMNDGNYAPESEKTDHTFFDGYRHIVDAVKSALPGIRITAIEASPYDDVTRPPLFSAGYNEVLISFSKWISNYAKGAGLNVADFNTPMVEMLQKANALAHEDALKILPDRVHPGFSGHLVMADQLLKSWNARPVVAAVDISVSGNSATAAAEHAVISHLAGGHSLSWTELDDALPLPTAEWEKMWGAGPVALVLKSSNFTADLNREPLKVNGLTSGSYSVKVDGQVVGTFNNDQLANGVNLALLDTPMTRQAMQVYDLTVSHCDVHNERWRTVEVPLTKYDFPATAPAMQAADKLEQAIVERRHQIAQPKEHRFEISLVE